MVGWDGVEQGAPAIGATAERSRRVGQREIELFTALTGDAQPLHTDEVRAAASRFGGLVMQGGVTSGILNAVVAHDLPGPGTVFLSVSWRFEHPAYVGDTLTGRVTVTSVRDDKPLCELATEVVNQHGRTCLSGTATTYTVALPAADDTTGSDSSPASASSA